MSPFTVDDDGTPPTTTTTRSNNTEGFDPDQVNNTNTMNTFETVGPNAYRIDDDDDFSYTNDGETTTKPIPNTKRNHTNHDSFSHADGIFHNNNNNNDVYSPSRNTTNHNRVPVLCLPLYYMFCCCLFHPTKSSHPKSMYGGGDTDGDDFNNPQKLNWYRIRKQMSLFYQIAIPYLKESVTARWILFGVLLLNGGNSVMNVVFSYVSKDFWNALSEKDADTFYLVLMKYMILLMIASPVQSFSDYTKRMLSVHWREWMTLRTFQLYTNNQVYYKLERLQIVKPKEQPDDTTKQQSNQTTMMSGDTIDNPDQRMTDDINTFTQFSIDLFLNLLTCIIDITSFSYILYTIYPKLLITCLLYAMIGTVITYCIGKLLVYYNFQQLRTEADLRYVLVRMRDNAESIAFYNGEELEGSEIVKRIERVMSNQRIVYRIQRNVETFTYSYIFLVQIVPVTVMAPIYFAGTIGLGVINQSVGAFNHVLIDLSILITQFEDLSKFSAGIERLNDFYEAIRTVDTTRSNKLPLLDHGFNNNTSYNVLNSSDIKSDDPSSSLETSSFTAAFDNDYMNDFDDSDGNDNNIDDDVEINNTKTVKKFRHINLQRWKPLMYSNPPSAVVISSSTDEDKVAILKLDNIDLCTPNKKRALISNLSFTLYQGEHLLIIGQSGIGKSSLLRAIAGLWNVGNGSIIRPADEDVYFLPQRPYCTIGTLKDQLLYPSFESKHDDTDVKFPKPPNNTNYNHVNHRTLKETLSDEDLLDILDKVDLYDVAVRSSKDGNPLNGLYSKQDWSNQLSLGEQQRLAFGRLLVNKPTLVILDEATSALDVESETKMYNLLRSNSVLTHQHSELDDYGHRKTSLGLTYVSIGHRPTIQQYHVKQLRLTDTGIDVTDVANSTFGTPSTEPPLLLNIASANTPTVASSTSETDIL